MISTPRWFQTAADVFSVRWEWAADVAATNIILDDDKLIRDTRFVPIHSLPLQHEKVDDDMMDLIW